MDPLEFATTRDNPLVDPTLAIWGWEVPVYLYLGGIVAGLLILSGYHTLLTGQDRRHVGYPHAPMLGVILLSIGMGSLFLDLEHKLHVWRLYLAFEPTSPMSWGSWILLLVYPALLAGALLHPPARVPFGGGLLPTLRSASAWIHARPRLVQAIGLSNLAGGIALGVYTGILLGAIGARPLWNSAILGPLFLFSGLSTAAALLHLLSLVKAFGLLRTTYADVVLAGIFQLLHREPETEHPSESHVMVRADAGFLTIEAGILALYLIGLLTSTAVHQQAAQLLVSGAYAPMFWGMIVISGILLPLFLQGMELAGRIRHTAAPAILVLLGGFLLRWVMVMAGQLSSWS